MTQLFFECTKKLIIFFSFQTAIQELIKASPGEQLHGDVPRFVYIIIIITAVCLHFFLFSQILPFFPVF